MQVCERLLTFLTQLYQFEHAQRRQSSIMTGVRAHKHVSFFLFIWHFFGEPEPGKDGQKSAGKEDVVVRNMLSMLPVQSETDSRCWALAISYIQSLGPLWPDVCLTD